MPQPTGSPTPRSTAPARAARLALVGCALLTLSCASVEFRRESQTSGTFTSTGTAITLLSWDIPKSAVLIARENASDARLPNLEVTSERIFPYLGWFDWLLDIVGIRYARVSGRWGFPPDAE